VIAYFARHPTAANLLMLVLVALGVLAIPQLQRETYPEFEPSTIRITASYPGAPTEIVDERIVRRIEDEIRSLDGIEQIRSQAREGGASLTIEVGDGVDLDALLVEIRSAVESIRDFPDDVDPPVVRAQSRVASVASVAVTGPMSELDLKLYCEHLKRELLRDPDVTQVAIAGFSTHRLRVRTDRAALGRHGLGLEDLSRAIAAHSLDAPVGKLETREGDIIVRYSDRRTDPEALGRVVVRANPAGGVVRIADVAEVTDTFAVEAEQTYFNGERAGLLLVSKGSKQDSLDVVAAVKQFIADQADKQPTGVTLTLTDDAASAIEDRLRLLVTNGLQGLVLVFATLWLFFGWRLAFWVGLGLPVTFLGALWVMLQLGQTLNMMTMLGLLVALGLLMDDAIVLADNVAAHLARGATPLRAAIDGVKEVAAGVLSSFLTTVCVFVPLSAMDGRIGRTLQVIPFVLIAVLAVSLIEAFFVLPNHLAHSLRSPREHPPGRFRRRFDAAFDTVRHRVVGRAVDAAVRHRYTTLAVVVMATLVSIAMISSGRLAYVAFPDTEGDVVVYKLELPPGSSLERTKREVARVVAAARKVSDKLQKDQPAGRSLVRNVTARFNYNPDVEELGPHVATVTVDLLSVEVRGTSRDAFTAAWREEIGPMPSAISASAGAGGRRGPGGNPIEIKIEGEDLAQLEEISAAMRTWFLAFDGVSDLSDDLRPGTTQVAVRLREGASAMGVTGAMLQAQLRPALGGVSVENFYVKSEEYELFVELDRASRDSIADLEQFPVLVPAGGTVPLGAIAHVDVDRSFARINRINGARTATVRGSLDPERANAAALLRKFDQELRPELEDRYPGVRFTLGGDAEESARTLGSMGRKLLLGLALMFVVLSLQFRSYVEPIMVILAIPFAFIGVVWGSLMIGQPLSSQSLLGFASLAGVVINDSLLLVLFIKSTEATGARPPEAARAASRARFRAILLTSATTIAGLMPLMFETSRQAQALIPVATAIVFGMAASTLLVLFALPAIYSVLADLGLITPRAPPPPPVTDSNEPLAPP
jgi:hydrophobic/amphiphilic exporter-1 (mainly G- bacteria), HAE1 family